MGRPKAFIPIDGVPLIRRILDTLAEVCPRLLIVASEAERFSEFDVPVAVDLFPRSGPLGGLHAALASAGGDSCLIVPCDQPFLSPALLERLGETLRAEAVDAVVPRIDGRLQPLTAAYASSALSPANSRLRLGQLRLVDFLGDLRLWELDEAACRESDPELRSFLNLNTPEDLLRAGILGC